MVFSVEKLLSNKCLISLSMPLRIKKRRIKKVKSFAFGIDLMVHRITIIWSNQLKRLDLRVDKMFTLNSNSSQVSGLLTNNSLQRENHPKQKG